ncbi:MAG: hypothetical protein R3264_11630, partial [Anaerolineae bacterium]|nr:hypothetical protein [Anaerolineae bacterium]
VAAAENFSHYQVEMGSGTNPDSFINVAGPINQMVNRGVLGVFDTTLVENGAYTLRLLVFDRSSGLGEARVRLLVDNVPTPGPTSNTPPTPTLTPTATATITPTVTATLEPTATTTQAPTSSPSPTTTPLPSATATKVPANTPTKVPAATNTATVLPSPTQLPVNTPTLPIELPTQTVTPTPAGEAGISTATPSP